MARAFFVPQERMGGQMSNPESPAFRAEGPAPAQWHALQDVEPSGHIGPPAVRIFRIRISPELARPFTQQVVSPWHPIRDSPG